jgi:hypothetical protein
MDKSQIIIISAVAAALAVRLYLRYVKKNKSNTGGHPESDSGSSYPLQDKDEEYEPYSKK